MINKKRLIFIKVMMAKILMKTELKLSLGHHLILMRPMNKNKKENRKQANSNNRRKALTQLTPPHNKTAP